MTARRFFIETFGCQMNEHDSEKIAGLLAHRGMVAVDSPQQADLYLLNTCSIREKAAQKVYSRLGQFKSRKLEDGNFVIGVVGCVAQQEGEDMVKKAPFIDLVVGTHMYHSIPDLLEEVDAKKPLKQQAQVATDFLDGREVVEIPSVSRNTAFRANITIMEGCNKHCSFCIVPFTRGKERNRPAHNILEESRKAVGEGYSEILLLGQTVNAYRDPDRPRFRFAELLAALSDIAGLRRIRFTSPHPREFDDATIAVIAEKRNICDQVHLPVQSGSSAVLRRMRRQHDREWFLNLVQRFRSCGRPISFSTDMIVGFPGESEHDFAQTLSLVEQVRFESMFSFAYSPRPFTEADDWSDDIPLEEKKRRLAILQRLQQGIQWQLHKERYLNRDFEILIEGTSRDGKGVCGRTTSNKVVNVEASLAPGTFARVHIHHVGTNSLRGQVLATPGS